MTIPGKSDAERAAEEWRARQERRKSRDQQAADRFDPYAAEDRERRDEERAVRFQTLADAASPPGKEESADALLYRTAANLFSIRRRMAWAVAGIWIIAICAALIFLFGWRITAA